MGLSIEEFTGMRDFVKQSYPGNVVSLGDGSGPHTGSRESHLLSIRVGSGVTAEQLEKMDQNIRNHFREQYGKTLADDDVQIVKSQRAAGR